MPSHLLHISRAADLDNIWDRRLYRALEIMPGFLAWTTIFLVVILSFVKPVWVAIFVIAFDIYWLFKAIYLSLHMRAAFVRMRKELKRNWQEELARARPATPELAGTSWQDLYHLVILPMYKEPLAVVRESFQGLVKARYPLDQLVVVLATEERAGQEAQETARAIEREFGHRFFHFLITTHPENLPGEIPGKGSNEAWAGNQVRNSVVDPLAIPYERIVTSVFDIDTVVHPDFFTCLTWHYLTNPKALRSSFQPIPLFINNIWEAPAFARVFAFSTTFWQMIQQARPERLVTFSSHSMSFRALADVGFWQGNMVSEDSRIFWQCLLHYDGDWQAVPLYFPVSMDANVASTFWQTAKNQYRQIRRWLYGAENNAYLLFGFLKNHSIPWFKKLSIGWFMVETTHSSATNSLIIVLLGWLPLFFGGIHFSGSILSYNLPQVTRTIMNATMLGLASSVFISLALLPPRSIRHGRFTTLWMVVQWLLFPINFIVFGAIPALDAQTRLMFGRYLNFWVTPKTRRWTAIQNG
ncbi:MAG: hypothetical protein AAB864_02745 [Patescibacteria group bacterium]